MRDSAFARLRNANIRAEKSRCNGRKRRLSDAAADSAQDFTPSVNFSGTGKSQVTMNWMSTCPVTKTTRSVRIVTARTLLHMRLTWQKCVRIVERLTAECADSARRGTSGLAPVYVRSRRTSDLRQRTLLLQGFADRAAVPLVRARRSCKSKE